MDNTDKIKQDEILFIEELTKRNKGNLFNNLSDFDKNLILWIRHTKPTIYAVLRSVSRSGMLRRFSCFVVKNGEIYYLNNIIKETTHYKTDGEGYLKVHGCGMDMAFKLVSDFSIFVFNDYKVLNYRLI